jgi:Tol biopolymer transport system component
MTRLTFHEATDSFPLWTPDGKRVAFESNREGDHGIYWKKADGTGKVEPIGSPMPDRVMHPETWSGDGKVLIMAELSTTNLDIGMLSMETDNEWSPLLHEKHNETAPRISPDGRWIAHISDETGQNEIYVRPFPEVDGGRWQVSTSGGIGPLWSPDGKELFYRSGDAVMAISVETEPTFSLGISKILFRGSYISTISGNPEMWDMHPDGKRFLMMKEATSDASVEGTSPPKINIVLNWFEELKERVPGD